MLVYVPVFLSGWFKGSSSFLLATYPDKENKHSHVVGDAQPELGVCPPIACSSVVDPSLCQFIVRVCVFMEVKRQVSLWLIFSLCIHFHLEWLF